MPVENHDPARRDIRLRGFAGRAPLAQAWLWLDAVGAVPRYEVVAANDAAGRILGEDITAPADLPPVDLAITDGYALRAAATEGASVYNPLVFTVSEGVPSDVSQPALAHLVSAGTELPPDCDAIVGFSAVSRIARSQLPSDRLEVLDAASPGDGVAMRGSMVKAGTPVLTAGRRLRPSDLAQIAALGIAEAVVWRCPRVGLVIAGPKAQAADGLGPMLRALIVRDGGIPEGGIAPEGSGVSLQAAIAGVAGADIIMVAGRSGAGEDDVAAISIAAAGGTLEMHGMALRPGSSSGLGALGTVPVILLPGDPPACLAAYDLLASRLIRRVGGFSRQPPYRIVTLPLRRKIVSAVGFTDIVPVAVSADGVTPISSVERINLATACRAAGFVVVPESLEGHPAGEIVSIHLYDPV